MAIENIFVIFLIALVASLNGLSLNLGSSISSPPVWSINVEVEQPLKSCEKLGITGDADFLGQWSPSKVVMLKKSELATKWTGSFQFPANSTVNYRYFIGFENSTDGGLQILKWETHLNGRTVRLEAENIETNDRFGIVEDSKQVHRGWLNSGYILQFKLFRNPIKLNESNGDGKIYVKVTPVDYDSSAEEQHLTPILNSGRANVEFVRMQYGSSEIRNQPEDGVPYETDDIVLFHITTNDLKNVAYKFTLSTDDNKNPEIKNTLGYQYLYPESITGTDGSTELVLMSPNNQNSIGTINIGFLLIKPLPSTQLNFKTSFSHYWRKNWTKLDVVHRGLGKSFKPTIGAAPITENTVATMKESLVQGADLVEFDVLLTKDLLPVIYHDDFVYSCLNEKKPTSIDDLTKIFIKDVTYDELKNLTTYHMNGSAVVEYPAHNNEPREDYRLFPSFEDLLTKVNHSIGFDIEIKPPQVTENTETIDKNVYIDRILDVMLRKGCGRLSFFSTIDADLCSLLRFKQNMFPVMSVGYGTPNGFADPRASNLKEIINNAQSMELLGVVPHSSYFINDGNFVKLATDLDVKIFIWGDDSDSKEMVDYFKSLGATGVVYSRPDLFIPEGKLNVFEQEKDLPKFFEKQCSCRNVSNATESAQDEDIDPALLSVNVF